MVSGAYLYSLYVPDGVRVRADVNAVWFSSSASVILAISDATISNPNSISTVYWQGQSVTGVSTAAQIEVFTNTSRQVRVGFNNTTTALNVTTVAWTDPRTDFTAPALAAEVTAYVSAVEALGGTVNTARRTALNALIQGLSADGLLSKVRYLLIYNACDGFTGCNVPLLRPVGLGNAVSGVS